MAAIAAIAATIKVATETQIEIIHRLLDFFCAALVIFKSSAVSLAVFAVVLSVKLLTSITSSKF